MKWCGGGGTTESQKQLRISLKIHLPAKFVVYIFSKYVNQMREMTDVLNIEYLFFRVEWWLIDWKMSKAHTMHLYKTRN